MRQARTLAMMAAVGILLAGATVWAQAPAAEHTTVISLQKDASPIPQDQQPTKEQLAKLFEVMRLRKQMENVMKMMPAMVQEQMKSQMKEMTSRLPGGDTLTPEKQEAVDKLMRRYMERAFGIYSVDEMLDDMTALYQRHLSRSDVDAFIAFYSSPAGQHLLDAQPAIMQEYMPVVMKRAQERSKGLMDDMAKDLQELVNSAVPAGEKPGQK